PCNGRGVDGRKRGGRGVGVRAPAASRTARTPFTPDTGHHHEVRIVNDSLLRRGALTCAAALALAACSQLPAPESRPGPMAASPVRADSAVFVTRLGNDT